MRASLDLDLIVKELEDNLRLRLGLFLILGIICIWVGLLLGDVRIEKQRDLDTLLTEMNDIQSIKNESFWQDQLDRQFAASRQTDIKIWRDQSPSLLAANLQGKIYAMASEIGVLSPEIRTSRHERVFRDQNLYRVKASVRGYYKGSRVVEFLEKIETHKPAISVDSVSIKTTSRERVNNRFDLIAVVYFQAEVGS